MKGTCRMRRAFPPSKRDRIEFCYMYREEFDQLNIKGWYAFARHPLIHYLAKIARSWFSYGKSYNDPDMIWSFYKLYKKLI